MFISTISSDHFFPVVLGFHLVSFAFPWIFLSVSYGTSFLVMNSFSFSLSECFHSSFKFEGCFYLMELQVDSFVIVFSLHSEKCLSDRFLAPCHLWWEVSSYSYHCFLCIICLFPSGCFSIFLLIFIFQKFTDVLRCGFLCNYTIWDLLGFLDLWSVMFLIKFGNNFVHFFKYISCPILSSSPSGTPVTIT